MNTEEEMESIKIALGSQLKTIKEDALLLIVGLDLPTTNVPETERLMIITANEARLNEKSRCMAVVEEMTAKIDQATDKQYTQGLLIILRELYSKIEQE